MLTNESAVAIVDRLDLPGPLTSTINVRSCTDVDTLPPLAAISAEYHVIVVENTPLHQICSYDSDKCGHELHFNDLFGSGILIEGLRIVDIAFFLQKFNKASKHNPAFGCSLSNMAVTKEIRKGFISRLIFHCNKCNTDLTVPTHNTESSSKIDVNLRAVTGVMRIGAGYSHLEEFCACLGVPCMVAGMYSEIHTTRYVMDGRKHTEKKEIAATEKLREAAQEEAAIAVTNGEVDEQGIPLLTVVADGSWSKRSYKTKYYALSGVAAIVGYHNRKDPFYGNVK
ncbi:hypothetical protein PR048_011343 [Dryococelus australis]|uniref:Mutator-like transposase domain-containing protein n=1 Tax=Dryococelus australis TaxID=614101 RepID=A0ABQ9HLD9_9NEOP|nr:hypothetical protein PR048_011343 [Dryococelus australis]